MPFRLIEDTPTPQQDQSLLQTVGRNVSRGAIRAAETALGLPGDIASGVLGLSNLGVEKLTGAPSPILTGIQEYLPTSSAIKKNVTSKIFGPEITEPQGKIEQFVDDVIGDLVSLAAPVKGKIPKPLSVLSRALAGSLTKEAAKGLGIGETGQEIAKIGAMTLAGIPGSRKSVVSAKDKSYKIAQNIAEASKEPINAESLKSSVKKILSEIKYKDIPDKEFIQNRAQGLLNRIKKTKKGDFISIANLWDAKKDLNKHFSKDLSSDGVNYLKRLVGAAKESIREFKNPEFIKNFNIAEEIDAALKDRSRIGKFLEKHVSLDTLNKNPLAKSLLLGGAVYAGGVGKALGAASAAVGSKLAARNIDLLMGSKEARKIYLDILSNSLAGNAQNVLRDIPKLEKSLENNQASKGRYILMD